MKRLGILLISLLVTAGAAAEPTEQEKIDALKLAYRLNGNSMVGTKMIDLTDPAVRGDAKVVTTVPVQPVAPPPPPVAKPAEKHAEVQDVCTRHGMHKRIRGKSWRCVR